jgi:hypothetical protein
MGLGVVLRDHTGKLIAGQSQTKEGAPKPSSDKALGAYGAICFYKELGILNLILEGDAEIMTKAICSNEMNMSLFGHVIAKVQNILQLFRSWKRNFVRREVNGVAHSLANVAKIAFMDKDRLGETLDCIRDVILKEQIALSLI